ncbi:MAG: hypothetical protein P0111_08750 [Nitrospira sp.]|nr:hypothetical protein [Nitrospira sp.]
MKPVIQEERTGCGIAAVAAIAGVSYATAKQAAGSAGIVAADPRLWSNLHHVRRLLSRFGIRSGRSTRPFRSWNSLPACALLAIKWHRHESGTFWHWVVYVADEAGAYVLDSKSALKTHVRTDFGRMKPKWYLPVFTMRRSRRQAQDRSPAG